MDCMIVTKGGFDFEAFKLSGVAAVLLAGFFSYNGFCNKERLTAADRPTKFILVLVKILLFFSVQVHQINLSVVRAIIGYWLTPLL